jgi:PAS domain-containing protein
MGAEPNPKTDDQPEIVGKVTSDAQAPGQRPWQIDSIFDSSDDAIICKTLDGVVISANAASERIFGYSPYELVGRPISLLIPFERLAAPGRRKADRTLRDRARDEIWTDDPGLDHRIPDPR